MNSISLLSIPGILYSSFILSLIALWTPLKRPIVPLVSCFILVMGLITKTYTWIVPLEIALLLFLNFIVETISKPFVKMLSILGTFALAFAMSRHFLPGFHNFSFIQAEVITPDATPYTMYWNFDKPWVSLILLFPVSLYSASFTGKVSHIFFIFLAALGTLLGLSYIFGYVRYDFKVPEFLWFWILNNLFITCIAEEALFRGFLQRHFMTYMPPLVAIGISSLFFGLLHYWGGWKYMILATLGGLFYGYQYHQTNRLEFSILTHFLVNLIHLIFFTYPALKTAF